MQDLKVHDQKRDEGGFALGNDDLDKLRFGTHGLGFEEFEHDDRLSAGSAQLETNTNSLRTRFAKLSHKLLTWGVELRGIYPVAKQFRTDRQFHKIFFIWFACNFNILSLSAGTVGPIAYGLGLRDSCLVILFFNILCCIPPAYLTTWGPKLGLRQMCQARYSFGYYGVAVPSVLNLMTMTGFIILNCILGGQTLAAVTDGHMSWTVGIVIIAIASLLISFCGYKVLNWYERLAWLPVLLVCLVALGVGGKHLSNPPPVKPTTPASVLSFGSVIAGFVLTYSPLSSDFTAYMDASVSSWRIFTYSYLGLLLPIVSLQCLGAAFGVAIPLVPPWSAAYAKQSLGDLFVTVLSPVGNFGKFLTVLLSLSVTANNAPTMYSFGLSFQVFLPFCAYLPRYLFSLLAFAIVVPLSIVGAHRFYETLTNFLGIIGYWASCFIAIVLTEHFVFRTFPHLFLRPTHHPRAHAPTASDPPTSDPTPTSGFSNKTSASAFAFENYNLTSWRTPRLLPTGIPALLASITSFGALAAPSMDQAWFIGPLARARGTGDIGFELAFVGTVLLYVPMRWVEVRLRGRL